MENNEFENNIPKPAQSSPYTVPKDYFNSLATRILARIEEEESDLSIPGITKDNPFKTPENYFNNLQARIDNQLTNEENDLDIPGISKNHPFTTPHDYFSKLHQSIDEKIFNEIALKEHESAQHTFVNRFYKLALTACLGGLMIWFGLNVYHLGKIDKQMSSPVNVVKIDNQNFDLNYFDESMIVDEVMNTKVSQTSTSPKHEQNSKLENYILNNVDEDLLLQEL